MSGLISDGERRVAIQPWETDTIAGLADIPEYDGFLASVGYEPRSCSIAEVLGSRAGAKVAVEFADQRTESYMESLDAFRDYGFHISREWDDAFLTYVTGWVSEIATRPGASTVAIDISSMNRKRIAAIVEVLSNLPSETSLTADLLYAPAVLNRPEGLPDGVITLAPVSAFFAGDLQPHRTAVGLVGVGYEPNKAAGALNSLEIPCGALYVPDSPDEKVREAVLSANRGLLGGADDHVLIEYEVLDPFDCVQRLEGRSRALLSVDAIPVIIPLGPKIFALSGCIVAAIHHPRVQVWRASFDADEHAMKRVADGSLCGLRIVLEPSERDGELTGA